MPAVARLSALAHHLDEEQPDAGAANPLRPFFGEPWSQAADWVTTEALPLAYDDETNRLYRVFDWVDFPDWYMEPDALPLAHSNASARLDVTRRVVVIGPRRSGRTFLAHHLASAGLDATDQKGIDVQVEPGVLYVHLGPVSQPHVPGLHIGVLPRVESDEWQQMVGRIMAAATQSKL